MIPTPLRSTNEPIGTLELVDEKIVTLGPKKLFLGRDFSKHLSWSNSDQTLIFYQTEQPNRLISVVETDGDEDILCCDVQGDGRIFVTGGTAGVGKIWEVEKKKNGKLDLKLTSILDGHSGEILSIKVSTPFKIIVTGSNDGSAIVWDLTRVMYVRSLYGHESGVTGLAISPTTGDIVTSCSSNDNSHRHVIRLFTINGNLVNKQICASKPTYIIVTTGTEGMVRNVILTGCENGEIVLWSSWDLTRIHTLNSHKAAVTALCFSYDHKILYSADAEGEVISWACVKSEGLLFFIPRATLFSVQV